MLKEPVFQSFDDEICHLSNKSFAIIELVELLEIPESNFAIIRRKLLNLGNDILRLTDKYQVGDIDGKE